MLFGHFLEAEAFIEENVISLVGFEIGHRFVRVHQSLRVTPAMEAGVVSKLWTMDDLVGIAADF